MSSCTIVAVTALLDSHLPEQRVSTGLTALDDVLDGLYWGDKVVWQLEGAPFEHYGSLQSEEAIRYAREIVEFSRAQMA